MAIHYEQIDLLNIRLHHEQIRRNPQEGEIVGDGRHIGNNRLHNAVLLSDINACLQEEQCLYVNGANAKGETPLHLAAINTSQEGVVLTEILLAKGGDVNMKNNWGQTPVLYAAITDSFETLQKLIAAPNIDIDVADLKGYNALHCLLSYRKPPSIEEETYHLEDDEDLEVVSSDLKQAICQFVKTGITLNCQTNFGNSILHLAARREDNTPLLRFILRNFPEIDLRSKNQMGENFLHVYGDCEIFENVSELLDEIASTSLPVLTELLAEKDIFGRTPWGNMIDDANFSVDFLQKVLSYGISVNTADNLGNTALHRIAGVSMGITCTRLIEFLVQSGADVNTENVYNETPGFVLFLENVFDAFVKNGMDFDKRNRWGRSPLVSIMKHRPIPDLLRKLIKETKADVNTKDMHGSSPLHFAAYHDYPEQVELLLEHGADRNAVDDLQDRPLDTARRHSSFHCYHILEMEDGDDGGVAFQVSRSNSVEQILLHMPRAIPLSRITSSHDVENFLGLQASSDEMINHLLTKYYRRPAAVSEEVEMITADVISLVDKLCARIGEYDAKCEMSIFPTGSSAEGTKVGRPDEFDFALCLEKLVDKTNIVMTEECLQTGYACLRFKDTPVPKEYRQFSDAEGYFLAMPFLQHLFRFFRRALNETNLWLSGNLYYNFEDKIKVLHGKPVFNFSVYWMGSVFKQLKISIDLVPAVYKRGWWPPNINFKEIPLANENVIDAGCFLILQTLTQDFDKKRHLLDDSISHTCNIFEDDADFGKRRMLRISATPAEIALVKSLPEKFRHAYALCKIVKSKVVSPEIEVDSIPTNRYYLLKKFQEKKALPIKPSEVIKSYMLKNCTLYALQEMRRGSERSYSKLNVSEIATKLCEFLLQFADEKWLKPYFLPFSDVFEIDEPKSAYTDFLLQLKREYSLKLMLGLLKHPFPEECLASKIKRVPMMWH